MTLNGKNDSRSWIRKTTLGRELKTLNASNVAMNIEQKRMTTLNARNMTLNAELNENGGSECQIE